MDKPEFDVDAKEVGELARFMLETYQALAPLYGYELQDKRKTWEDADLSERTLMVALAGQVIRKFGTDKTVDTALHINEHPVLAGLEGNWSRICMILMDSSGIPKFRITSAKIEALMKKYKGMPTFVVTGEGPTGEEEITLRIMNQDDATELAKKAQN